MSTIGLLALALLIGYLIGSITPGYYYVKWATGQDVRDVASGRTGGTNSYRAAGLRVGLLTGISDILKGSLALLVATWLLRGAAGPDLLPWLQAAAGVTVVLGHNHSIYLGFRGGAGTTPNIGWATAVWWPLFPITILTGFLLFYFVGMASVVSLSIGFILPLVFGIRWGLGLDPTPAYFVGSLITMLIVTLSLRPNIERLLNGNERVVGPRAKRIERRKQRKAHAGN